MKKHFLRLVYSMFMLLPVAGISQLSKADSLQQLLGKATHDTTKASLLWQIGWEYKFTDPVQAEKLGKQSLDLSLKTGYRRTEGWAYNLLGALKLIAHDNKVARTYFEKGLDAHASVNNIRGMASCYSNMANIFTESAVFDSAVLYQQTALELRLKLSDKKPAADSYTNLGNIHNLKGEYGKAAEYLFKALKVYEQMNDQYGISMCHYNIGRTYYSQQKYEKAIEYMVKSRKAALVVGDKRGVANSYVLESGAKQLLNRLNEALSDLSKAIHLQKETGDKYGLQFSYSNSATIFLLLKEYDLALEYHELAREIAEESGNTQAIAVCYYSIGEVYRAKGELKRAAEYQEKALDLATQINALEERKGALNLLQLTYSEMKDFKKAYEYLSRYVKLKDSMQIQESTKQLQELQTQYDTDKKQKEIELLTKNQEIQAERLSRQRIVTYAIVTGLVLVLILAFLTYKRYREKQRANELLAQQKVEILNKNQDLQQKNDLIGQQKKEITDSIEYAKTIQEAMLPSEREIREIFPEMFVLFQPKDIVSGDFYWIRKQGSVHYVAAADCTGHGVPGAFMSMIGNDKLNFAIQEKKLAQPAAILAELNKGIREALKQNTGASTSRDGMDIALCAYDTNGRVLQYAGANRSLYKISKGVLTEYKPTKSAIAGFTPGNFEYQNVLVDHEPGDLFYLCTDGYADQFGGEQGKKMMTKNFKELLLSVSHQPLQVQKEELAKVFDRWKNSYEQIDDVLVIGFRL